MTLSPETGTRVRVCALSDLEVERGRAALFGSVQIALFVLADGSVHAVSNLDPYSGAHVMSRGIVGTRGRCADAGFTDAQAGLRPANGGVSRHTGQSLGDAAGLGRDRSRRSDRAEHRGDPMTVMLGVDLTGRDVLLVGGGAVAAKRIRRFLDEGARVRIVAPVLHPETARLVELHGLVWRAGRFRGTDLAGAWLVHTATGDARVDRGVAERCERKRILCINASDGAHGSTRLTAQAEIGDVTVAVTSTVGCRPASVGRRAGCDRRPRRRRPHPAASAPCRSEWTRRPGRRWAGPRGPDDGARASAHRRSRRGRDRPPGTRGGDRPRARPRCRGDRRRKTPGRHPVPQDEINRIIVGRAAEGRRVVRLKGGDPFVFGRGGEEMRACLAAGIPVDITPGISSAIAVPQAAGIPVTHRGTAAAFHVVNGQGIIGEGTLAALADATVTTGGPDGRGRPRTSGHRGTRTRMCRAERPIAFVESGHTAQQRTTRTTLGRAVADAEAVGLRNPAVIVVGEGRGRGTALPLVGHDRGCPGVTIRVPLTPVLPDAPSSSPPTDVPAISSRLSSDAGGQVYRAPALSIIPNEDDELLIARTRDPRRFPS